MFPALLTNVVGDQVPNKSPTPKKVPDLENVVAISCGNAHSLALTEPGHVYSWGRGDLGLALFVTSLILFRTTGPSSSTRFLSQLHVSKEDRIFRKYCCHLLWN